MLKKLVNAKAKDFVNSKAKEWFGADKSPNQVNSAQAGSKTEITSPSLGTVEQKPFKINLNELWQYDYEELSDFIPQYEEYITFLRQKCHEAMDRYFAAEEQIEQLKQEKSVPTDRADRTRQQTGDLLDAVTPTALSPSFTKEKSELDLKRLEEIIAEKMKFIYVDESLLSNLKETASKTVEQLVEIRNILFSNTSQIVGMQFQENNNENPDYLDLLSDNPNQNANQANTADQFVDFKIRGTTRDEVINLIGDIEMTTQLVFPKFTDINNKLKSQEKLIIKEINHAFSNLKKTKSESLTEVTSPEISQISRVSEGELAEIRTQLETTKSKLIEVEKRNHGMSIQIVDISAREESYKQEVKNLNVKIGDLEKKIKEGENSLKKADNTIKERENKLQQADTKYKQLETKVKEMEGKIKEGEKTKKEMENKLKETENKTNELEAKLSESENKIKDTAIKLKNAQDQKEEIVNQFGWLKREHQDLISSKEKVEGESGEEVTKLQDRIFFLENDNVRLKEKAIEAEQSKTDLENKVIQERLKHHQTIGDMQKLGESLKEAEKHLDNEVEAHKAVVHKNESLKKKIAENDKKMLDYKKTIKRLSQQVLDLHNKINDSNRRAVIVSPVNNVIEKVEEIEERADTENVLEGLQVEDLDQELKEKGQLIAQQAEKIQALLGKLEEAVQESLAVKKDNEDLKKEKETLRSQNKVLQDKRESGLLEIQRLNNAIDRLKEKYPDIGTNLVQPIVPKGIADKITSPTRIEEPLQSPPLMKHSSSSIASPIETSGQKKLHQPSRSISIVTSPSSKSSMPGTSQISAIKKNLDTLYKEVILALTSEKLNAKKGSNTASAPGEKSIEEELGESLVKIEKKVNDTILLLQDYIEVVSKAWKSAQ